MSALSSLASRPGSVGGGASARKRVGILIIVENLSVPFDRRVWQEATTLKAAGHEVSVICPKGAGAEAAYECLDGVHIHRHPMPMEAKGAKGYAIEYGNALFWQVVLSLRVHRARRFDVIHACNPPDLIFLVAALFKVLFGTRFVFDHHDLNPELYVSKFGRRDVFHRLLVWAERATFALADISIATNQSYRQVALDRGRMKPERVFVVRSGPNLDRVRRVPERPELKRGRAHLVGYVGVMGHQEGIDLLLEAVRVIVRERGRDDVQFGIVGGGPALDEMRALSARMGLADHVTFTGRVHDATLLAMLSTADLCVNPDRVDEMNDKSTMNKIMEYMALGKAIVQFDVTEGRVSAGDSSLYAKANDPVDMADRILELIDDADRRREMGELGRERVLSELSWDHEAPKLLAAYAALSALRARRPEPVPEGAR